MTILSATQIRELDRFTIENEPITSIDLMERAATANKAHLTLSFLPVKRAFLFPENKSLYGEIVYLDIELLLDDYLRQRMG
jgi:NAD(P)H-hydrate repair Nnr-like enzyme with NAD(P)H-hydrate epimerase domain